MPKDCIKPQIHDSMYYKLSYLAPTRFASYAYQLAEVMALKPRIILEIGIGNGIVSYLLRKAGVKVITMDIDPLLQPDIVGSVTDIPTNTQKFDVVACFEVLEHIPLDKVKAALLEIHRVSRKYFVISLPERKRFFKLEVWIPHFGRHGILWELPFIKLPDHKFDGEHYWEVNKKGSSLKQVLELLTETGFVLLKTYRIPEFPRHRMFLLQKSALSE